MSKKAVFRKEKEEEQSRKGTAGAKFLVPDWGRDKVDYGIGLFYRNDSLCSLAGRQPYATGDNISQSVTKNLTS